MIGVVVFMIMLFVYMIFLVFINYDYEYLLLRNLFGWVGFVNFKNVLNGDIFSMFFLVFGWIFIWVFLVIVICFFFGVLFVFFINYKGVKFKKFWCIIFVIIMVVFLFVLFFVM